MPWCLAPSSPTVSFEAPLKSESAPPVSRQNKTPAGFGELSENYDHASPGDPADLWEHLSSLSHNEFENLLSFAAAYGVNAVNRPFDSRFNACNYTDQFGQALSVDMTCWFIRTGASSFQDFNCSGIEARVAEAEGEDVARNVLGART